MTTKEKIAALRAEMKAQQLDGFIIPRSDEYQGEFVAPYAERLKWISGFTGSAGAAIVLADRAVVLSDGRYTIQLKQQLDAEIFENGDSVKTGIGGWIEANASAGMKIGFDPMLHTQGQIDKIETSIKHKGIELVAVKMNPLDRVWPDQPERPLGAVEVFPEEISGKTLKEKIKSISDDLRAKGKFACVLALPESLSWLLNVRGNDVECLPVALSCGIIYADDRPVQWIIDARKISGEVNAHLGGAVEICAPERIEEFLINLAKESAVEQKPVQIDFNAAPIRFKTTLEATGAKIENAKDPCIAPRAIKTESEKAYIREAHKQDAAALVKFLSWLDDQEPSALDEILIENKLLEFRRANNNFRGPSFATIAGFGANGAIVHYRASEKTNTKFSEGNLLLLDSGGQYFSKDLAGTTDITRTIAIGAPSAEMKERFTTVLKGHIAVARARFPEGTTGVQIDALARQPLWEAGIDYAHGTGHGVGCYLSVHEEAASISPRGNEALKAGMLLSNEPGYYKEGAYGIRIENLVFVKQDGPGMLAFETVSFVPIDRRLIVKSMLSSEEIAWLDFYHAQVLDKIGATLDMPLREWLKKKTAKLD